MRLSSLDRPFEIRWVVLCTLVLFTVVGSAQVPDTRPTLAELKRIGAQRSSYRNRVDDPSAKKGDAAETPKPRRDVFRKKVQPALKNACQKCHGAENQESDFRVDTLDPDLLHGDDVNWWLEVLNVLSNGEMPPDDADPLGDDERGAIVDWLSAELQTASIVRRNEESHSSFRRMTKYEFNYALQDLLGLPFDFAKDLPPEPASHDGFTNSSEVLHVSAMQFQYYHEIARQALIKATARGDQPAPIYWDVSMQSIMDKAMQKHYADIEKRKKRLKDEPEKLKREIEKLEEKFYKKQSGAHIKELATGKAVRTSWSYRGARHALAPSSEKPDLPKSATHVAILPPRQRMNVELGNTIPNEGTLRIRVSACRMSDDDDAFPTLGIEFGWQASNNSAASIDIGKKIAVLAAPGSPQVYEWNIPLSEITLRNPMRLTAKMGETPSPSEYLKFKNMSLSRGVVQIESIQVVAPAYDQWPPASHRQIFFDDVVSTDTDTYEREILTQFMQRAWRRPIRESEINQKLKLLATLRPKCDDFQEAMTEVLATVIASPKFLYVSRGADSLHQDHKSVQKTHDFEFASRLSIFLWCSIPDQELMDLAANGKLREKDVLIAQTRRMLADERSDRFTKQFVRGWLGMQLLDFLDVDRKRYRQFDPQLKDAMQQEPVELFREILREDRSAMDFLHSDYAMVNERLSHHYGIRDIYGTHFRKVALDPTSVRGGLLTQAGLLAMNSDGNDSHPLKRGIWMLEKLLNDPPPPPPPAVPEIDLADPEIAKLTLKERIENHRNNAACISCHSKIDPWGIAFENFDAVGSWRSKINGKDVDATSLLFNKQKLDGIDGLKRYLLNHRQDQFARALVHKMTTFALGRPLTFSDRSDVDRMTAHFRQNDDRLASLIELIVTSELFAARQVDQE